VELAVDGSEGETALDLYAGVGLFTLPLARRFKTADAVESGAGAVRDLEHNVRAAGLQAGVHRAASEAYLEALETAPDFVLADPPRAGLGKSAVRSLLRIKPRRIHIVSCDPATLARDLAALTAGGYHLDKLMLIDLFPQTFHIESVAVLTR
jgi:23S rRNA (uracil1939-C5)-methyltransferase